MTWPTAVILLPCLGILAATLFINHRFRFWLPVALAVASVVSGTVYLRTGIHETCLIAESECLGGDGSGVDRSGRLGPVCNNICCPPCREKRKAVN